MKAIIQRVSQANVKIRDQIAGEIEQGLMILLGVSEEDEKADAEYLADKIANLRIFNDAQDKMNLSLLNIEGEALVISQFTLYASTRKGRRPSFTRAALPEQAEPLYEYFAKQLENKNVKVARGVFGATMMVQLVNDGPVTIIIESKDRLNPRQ